MWFSGQALSFSAHKRFIHTATLPTETIVILNFIKISFIIYALTLSFFFFQLLQYCSKIRKREIESAVHCCTQQVASDLYSKSKRAKRNIKSVNSPFFTLIIFVSVNFLFLWLKCPLAKANINIARFQFFLWSGFEFQITKKKFRYLNLGSRKSAPHDDATVCDDFAKKFLFSSFHFLSWSTKELCRFLSFCNEFVFSSLLL